MLQIKKQFQEILKEFGLEEIKALGEKFDPNLHEIVAEGEGVEAGLVIEEIQKGYKVNGHLLRPTKIKVAK